MEGSDCDFSGEQAEHEDPGGHTGKDAPEDSRPWSGQERNLNQRRSFIFVVGHRKNSNESSLAGEGPRGA